MGERGKSLIKGDKPVQFYPVPVAGLFPFPMSIPIPVVGCFPVPVQFSIPIPVAGRFPSWSDTAMFPSLASSGGVLRVGYHWSGADASGWLSWTSSCDDIYILSYVFCGLVLYLFFLVVMYTVLGPGQEL